MITKIMTASLSGIDAVPVEVEADVSNGLPATIIVGLPDTAVQESRERVRLAIRNSNFSYPQTRVSINLAPADVQKNGTHFDLPIAVAILSASELVKIDSTDSLFVGELSLDGMLRPCYGVVAMLELARSLGCKNIFIPAGNAQEASLVKGISIYLVTNLEELISHFLGIKLLTPIVPAVISVPKAKVIHNDFSEIAGQHFAKRALEIVAAGNHNIRLIGPPGSGKTMLAKALPGILPPLSHQEQLLQMRIVGAKGKAYKELSTNRPFRSPHHTSSAVALIGGGSNPVPGEVTLAHNGILFLDEFPEFNRNVLEVLRQPLEDGYVSIARAKNSLQFPATFLLVAAQNPCPCGNHGEKGLLCQCLPPEVQKYNKKLSGPLLDRIDLHVRVPRLAFSEMNSVVSSEASIVVAKRVERARKIQHDRFKCQRTNSQMTATELKQYCVVNDGAKKILESITQKHNLSGRSIHRLLKVARTIADLETITTETTVKTPPLGDQKNLLTENHILEAFQYRVISPTK